MRKFKVFFLLTVFILSFGLTSNVYARERNGSKREEKEYISRGCRNKRKKEKNYGPRLDYDGKTSGIGSKIGGHLGGLVGGTLGAKYGGTRGMIGGSIAGGEIGSKIGDRLESHGNRHAHNKWNSRGRKGHSGWRFSLDEVDDYEEY